jgi:hypothetical protein
MLTIRLINYPNFFRDREYDGRFTWEEEFREVGFKSVISGVDVGSFSISEEDYTMFLLRFG